MFPHNIVFRHADWVKNRIPEDEDGYEVVLGFVPFAPSISG